MSPNFPLFFLLPFLFAHIHAWNFFELPIQMAKPSGQNGVYEFDLVVDYRLSMTLLLANGTTPVLDYSAERQEWSQRDPSMHSSCNAKLHLLEKREQQAEGDRLLDSLVQLDGLHRLVTAVNGISPGPTLVVPFGAEVLLRVRNRLHSQALSVHVHGLLKEGRWWTDGVPFLQQCPIAPGSDYSYRFIADTPGTHWYHGHLMGDRAGGLVGGFVVLRPDERMEFHVEGGEEEQANQSPLKVGRQYLALLQDVPPVDASRIYLDRLHWRKKWIGHSLEEAGCERVERTFDGTLSRELPVSAILVGAKGWHNQSDIRQFPTRLPLTNFAIKPGENILIRLVNAGISQGIFVWLEDHNFWVVAADGSYIRPVKVDSLLIFSGERYDILVQGLSQPRQRNYRIIFELMEQFWEQTAQRWRRREPTVGLANLHYNGTVEVEEEKGENEVDWDHRSCTRQSKCRVLNCPFAHFPPWANMTCIHADELKNLEPTVEESLEGEHVQEMFANLHDGLNGWRFLSPKGIPYFHQKNGPQQLAQVAKPCDPGKCDRWAPDAAWNSECQCFLHFHFPLGQLVQINAVSAGGMAHPLHLHGTKFVLLRMGFAEQHPGNGTIRGLNRHLECTKPGKPCVELQWSNKSWWHGNVPELKKNPVPRDSVVVPAKGFAVIRFRANNPGWFFAHCHLLMHSMDGMNFAFRVGNDRQIPAPPIGFPHDCGIYEEGPLQQNRDQRRNGATEVDWKFVLMLAGCQLFTYLIF